MTFKKKAIYLAATAAMGVAASAQAHLPWSGVTQTVVKVSGASAPSNMLMQTVINDVCASNIDVFVDQAKAGTPGATADDILAHTEQWAVACTAKTSITTVNGGRVFVKKSDVGGSGNGTTPVANSIAVSFMNLSSASKCTSQGTHARLAGGNYTWHDCDGTTVNEVPNAGASDIEPNKFVGSLAPASGDFNKPTANWIEQPMAGLVFGVVVTRRMYQELQLDQFGTADPDLTLSEQQNLDLMPSLPSSYIRSVFQGKVKNWVDLPIHGKTLSGSAGISDGNDAQEIIDGTLNTYNLDPAQVHLCRRVQGSGTHAQFMIHNLRTNCQGDTAGISGWPGGGFVPWTVENSSSGTLGTCMHALDTGTSKTGSSISPDLTGGHVAYAMGYQSLEKNMNLGENYRFVKIDGIAPTLENAHSGNYRDVYYMTMQYKTNSPGYTAAGGNVLNAMANLNAGAVGIINKGFVHNFGKGGFLQPSASAPALFSATNPLTPWARVNSAGNPDSCAPLTSK